MPQKIKLNLLISTLLLLLIPALSAFAQEDPFAASVSPLTKSIQPGSEFEISALIKIKPHYFIYKDRTKIEVEPSDGFAFGDVIFPKAETKFDKFLEQNVDIYKGSPSFSLKASANNEIKPGQYDVKLFVYYQGCSEETCYLPQRKEFTISVTVLEGNAAGGISGPKSSLNNKPDISPNNPFANKSLLGALVLAFIAGIGVSFTPCIYPMIPITVAIIGGQASHRPLKGFYLSLFYVLGIAVVYSALGVAAASTGALFGSAVNSPWVVGCVAAVFIALAFSMFGVYELKMPTAMAEKFGGKKKGGGVLGVFLLGLISGTVASPCVGPVLVSLLVFIAGTGSKVLGFWLLFVFSWGMGLILIAVGTFSGAMNAMPKSGTWMVMVKKVLGVLLLGAALYYLKAIIPEQAFLIILGVFLIVVGVFSGGFDRLVSESSVMPRVKKSFGILCVIFGLYFLGGTLLTKGLILGPFAFSSNSNATIDNEVANPDKFGIEWMLSEEQGLKMAQNISKPVMIDFWAEWCSVCKKLEKKTLYDPIVINASKNFVNIKIDCTDVDDSKIKSLWKKYGIVGLPTIIFVDKDGAVLNDKTVNGFVKPSEFKKIMDSVL